MASLTPLSESDRVQDNSMLKSALLAALKDESPEKHTELAGHFEAARDERYPQIVKRCSRILATLSVAGHEVIRQQFADFHYDLIRYNDYDILGNAIMHGDLDTYQYLVTQYVDDVNAMFTADNHAVVKDILMLVAHSADEAALNAWLDTIATTAYQHGCLYGLMHARNAKLLRQAILHKNHQLLGWIVKWSTPQSLKLMLGNECLQETMVQAMNKNDDIIIDFISQLANNRLRINLQLLGRSKEASPDYKQKIVSISKQAKTLMSQVKNPELAALSVLLYCLNAEDTHLIAPQQFAHYEQGEIDLSASIEKWRLATGTTLTTLDELLATKAGDHDPDLPIYASIGVAAIEGSTLALAWLIDRAKLNGYTEGEFLIPKPADNLEHSPLALAVFNNHLGVLMYLAQAHKAAFTQLAAMDNYAILCEFGLHDEAPSQAILTWLYHKLGHRIFEGAVLPNFARADYRYLFKLSDHGYTEQLLWYLKTFNLCDKVSDELFLQALKYQQYNVIEAIIAHVRATGQVDNLLGHAEIYRYLIKPEAKALRAFIAKKVLQDVLPFGKDFAKSRIKATGILCLDLSYNTLPQRKTSLQLLFEVIKDAAYQAVLVFFDNERYDFIFDFLRAHPSFIRPMFQSANGVAIFKKLANKNADSLLALMQAMKRVDVVSHLIQASGSLHDKKAFHFFATHLPLGTYLATLEAGKLGLARIILDKRPTIANVAAILSNDKIFNVLKTMQDATQWEQLFGGDSPLYEMATKFTLIAPGALQTQRLSHLSSLYRLYTATHDTCTEAVVDDPDRPESVRREVGAKFSRRSNPPTEGERLGLFGRASGRKQSQAGSAELKTARKQEGDAANDEAVDKTMLDAAPSSSLRMTD